MKLLHTTSKNHTIWILTSLALSCFLGRVEVSSAAEDTWIRKADTPTARQLHSSSVVDGKIYVIGGGTSEPNLKTVRPVEVYDTITDSWTQKADIPTGRGVLSACVVDGKIYAIGGAGIDFSGLPTLEVYDPVTDTWTRKADMPTPRAALSASAVNGKIYAIGGTQTLNYLSGLPAVEEYDPSTDTWIRKADLPTPRFALCTSVVDGKIYAIGGGTQSPARNIVEAYDPATDTWTRKADMPTARRNFATCVVEGRIYAIGGWLRSSLYAFTTVEQYDPVMDAWTTEADLPVPRAGLSANAVDGQIYAIGGTNKTHPCPALSTVFELTVSAPNPDFNGDGIVDCLDVCILIEHWQMDYPLCDIAPPPSGDGIVDVQDLIEVAEHLFEEILPPGLLAYWKFDETEGAIAYELVGGKDGYLFGDPAWQPDAGMKNGTLQFDGVNDYILSAFNLNPAYGSFSVVAWIQGGAPGQVIISQMDGNGSGETWLGIDPLNGCLMTGLVPPPAGRFVPQALESETIITDGRWHHAAFVWDGGYRTLYVDGMQVARDTDSSTSLENSDGAIYIGVNKNLDSGTFFSGLIDDVRIYNIALTSEQISAMAQ